MKIPLDLVFSPLFEDQSRGMFRILVSSRCFIDSFLVSEWMAGPSWYHVGCPKLRLKL